MGVFCLDRKNRLIRRIEVTKVTANWLMEICFLEML